MPAIEPTTPRLDYKFKGKAVRVPVYFNPGDALTEDTARFANRQLASVTGNVLASALNRAVEKLQEANDKLADTDTAKRGKDKPYTIADISDATAQALFDSIYTNYQPGVTTARGEGILRDPIQSIADNIAWEKIKARLVAKKLKVSSVKGDKKAELIANYHKLDPSVMEQAKTAYAGNAVTDGMDNLFEGLTAEPATPAGTETENAPVTSDDTTPAPDAGNDTIASPEVAAPDATTPAADAPQGAEAIPGGMVNSEDVTGTPAPEPEALPGVDNPGQPEVAPDASVGEQTPQGGAFA